MFLNNENDIKLWLIKHSEYLSSDINRLIYFTKDENNHIIVNCSNNLSLYNVEELNVKFGHINGNFKIHHGNLSSFEGFPNIVNGNLISPNCSFQSTDDWNVQKVFGLINLCGEDCNLKNMFFLKNMYFQEFILQYADTPFIDNKIPDLDLIDKLNLKSITDDYSFINKDNYKHLINTLEANNLELDDYLNSFENKLSKEIK